MSSSIIDNSDNMNISNSNSNMITNFINDATEKLNNDNVFVTFFKLTAIVYIITCIINMFNINITYSIT